MRLEYLSGNDDHDLDNVVTYMINNPDNIKAIGLDPVNAVEIYQKVKLAWNTPQRVEVYRWAKSILATIRRRNMEYMYNLPQGYTDNQPEYDNTWQDIIQMASLQHSN